MITDNQIKDVLRQSWLAANQKALQCGTKIIVWKDGGIVELEPTATAGHIYLESPSHTQADD